jgi:hypothetical protein
MKIETSEQIQQTAKITPQGNGDNLYSSAEENTSARLEDTGEEKLELV